MATTWPNGETRTGRELRELTVSVLHQKSGGLHGVFVSLLPEAAVTGEPLTVLRRLHELATERVESGLVALAQNA